MKEFLTLRSILAFSLLWLGMVGSGRAQALGTAAATAWIGQPLEMTVPVRFASPEVLDECAQAEVFFGATRLPAHRVRATILGSDPQQKHVRIETDTVIDEPVVTVSLRTGCRNAVTRSYTVLADVPSEQVLAALAAQRPGAVVAAAPLSPAMAAAAAMAPLQLAAATGSAATGSPEARTAPSSSVVHREAAAPRTIRTVGTLQVAASPRQAGPRLRLVPIEADAIPFLRASARMAAPEGDAARRAAAALLWQAINADPQEVLRTTEMLQNVERDLAWVREDAGRTRAEMATLRQRLDAAQPGQPPSTLLQSLLVFLLLSAAAAAVLWYRTRPAAQDPWYAPLAPKAPRPREPAQADHVAEGPQAEEPFAADEAVAVAAPAGTAASGQRRGADGVLRVETLAAVLAEVEFLSSLGLAADAAAVLEAYLEDSASPAPIAFFELMRLCDPLEDSRPADLVRRRYAQVFGVAAPRLGQVTAPLGLECMPVLSGRITAAWNTPRALQVIEETLFGPSAAATMLTLQAGRDLLCLHDLAMSLAPHIVSSPAGNRHALAPWAHAQDAVGARIAVQAMRDVGDGSALSLDLDLSTELHAAARAAEQRAVEERVAEESAALLRSNREGADPFSAAMAFERIPLARH